MTTSCVFARTPRLIQPRRKSLTSRFHLPVSWAIFSALAASALLQTPLAADVPSVIQPVGMGLGGFNYYSSGPFADTMKTGGGWLEYTTDWGTGVYFYNTDGTPNPQFDSNGYPKYLNTGKKLRLLVWPYGPDYGNRPSTWPKRGNSCIGKWVIAWQGDADIRIGGGTFLSGESNGPATGRIVNGRRVYNFTYPSGNSLTVEDINAANPVTNIKIWLPDPANPQNQTLEGQFWHPDFLATIGSLNHLRFMDWGVTNASPQQDWIDRRKPSFGSQHGVLNRRNVAPGTTLTVTDRSTGLAFEYMVKLCNDTGKDMWVCVPHLATDDFITKLANLIRYGSDGVNPYTSTQASPVYPPLNSNLKVWVEYSNEIWSNGSSFPQGNWAAAQGTALGITKEQFIGRRYAQIWRIFQQVFGGSQRVVRVAGLWTGSSSYNTPMLTELKNYGAGLTPAVAVDVVSPTTYFGNGIQDWAYEQANLTRGTANQWFHTASDFTSGSTTRPISVPKDDPYWTSAKFSSDQAATFVEWKKRIFSGSSAAGGGPDSTGVGGGFSDALRQQIIDVFGSPKPFVAYEGGPSLYTDYYDGGDARDDGVTTFFEALNRRSEFAEIYRIQLNMARSKGLDCHSMFVDVSSWGKYGQWGHLEYPAQTFASAVKWTAVSDWRTDMGTIRHIDYPVGGRPIFETAAALPNGLFNTPYSQDIVTSGGDGAPILTVIGSLLSDGLTLNPVSGDPYRMRLAGAAQEGGWNYAYLRVADADGDASWRVYSMYVAGGPGTIVESDITGSFAGSSSLPWTKAHTVDAAVTFSGWDRGAPYVSSGGTVGGTGVNLFTSTDSLLFSVSQGGASQADSTLASAIADNEYWKFTITPQTGQPLNLRNAEMRFTWVRVDYHAPRNFAVFSTVGGFAEGQQFYTLARTPSEDAITEHVFNLPDTAAYENRTTPVEFRIYFYGSQYAHKGAIKGLKLSRNRALYTAMPVFAPPAGTYSSSQNVALNCATSGATIKYTTNGTTPSRTVGSTYASPIAVSSTATLKAMAYKDGLIDSDVVTALYTIDSFPVITTTSLPNATQGAAYSTALAATGGNSPLTWSLSSGSLPAGLSLSAGGLISGTPTGSGTSNFTARVTDADGDPDDQPLSLTVVAVVVATPAFSPAAGTYTSPQTVTISCATSGATIRYTTDGTTPSPTVGTVYSAPVSIAATATLKAIAYKTGLTNSAVASGTYTIKVVAPAFTPAAGSYPTAQTVTIATTTSGATIRYTTDGTTPSQTVGTVYSAPVNITVTTTLKAIAYKTGLTDSDVTTGVYTIGGGGGDQLLAEESFNYTAGTVLHGLTGGGSFGWNGTWVVEGGTAATGYKAVAGSLAYSDLYTAANQLEGGYSYQTCGRAFDIAGTFASYKNTSNLIGVDGKTLWLAWVVKLASTASGYSGKVALDYTGAVFHDNLGIVRVNKDNSTGQWTLSLLNEAHVLSTGLAATTNPTLMVLRIQFGATDTVDLWVNPPLYTDNPGTPSASLSTTGTIQFNEITYRPYSGVAGGWLDEVRAGTSYAMVTPTVEEWLPQDVGAVAATGSTTIGSDGSTFTLKGSGADIWGSADEFQFCRLQGGSNGDAEMVARVVSVQNTNGWAKAGVMIRETNAANSRHAMMVVTPTSGVSFQRRTATGGTSASTTTSGQTAPKWVKISRTGNIFRAYWSNDGSTWTKVGSDVTIAMTATAEIGLCVTSHKDGTLCTAVFDNVTVTP